MYAASIAESKILKCEENCRYEAKSYCNCGFSVLKYIFVLNYD